LLDKIWWWLFYWI